MRGPFFFLVERNSARGTETSPRRKGTMYRVLGMRRNNPETHGSGRDKRRACRRVKQILRCAQDDASSWDASVAIGGEDDVPEERGGRQELDGKERAFLIHLGRADNVDLDLLLGLRIFEDEFGALGQAFGKNDHGAGGT